ncbi:histidinol dehydrogenase [Conexibacter woesei]|uniref:Histidinol dehydrogenase n=1 Tax=Conexibacter woesei (strain DSM 14684 / CCUG 47730 / CIP 108061 / JCM 11494 / NBRC 100937 / ID131577) TaxID=469383 RepID=D3F4Y6_CONWI|nr:histidinol dehydrogenase [Conexibacter woesei]ADB48564.1 histidinol dehydrogenase [Conexibacter woesei DSM 14684]
MAEVLKAARDGWTGARTRSGRATSEGGDRANGASDPAVVATVAEIIGAVRERGDAAVRELSARFDRWEPESFRLTTEQIDACVAQVSEQALADLRWCQEQVRAFALAQRASLHDVEVETQPGVRLGHRHVPIARVGAYIPGGRYPMIASAAMSILTAKAAGVEHVIACTPPLDGAPPALTVAAMQLAGADEIHVLGGVQAVAAMAVGTETIERVDFLAGPGNAYVAEAKRQLFGEVGIDLFAGPTEILVVADETADPEIVAADLLGQAEHGLTSPAALIATDAGLARAALAEIERQLQTLPTADVAGPAWRDYGEVHLVGDREEAAALADAFAYEHVEILTAEPRWFLDTLRQYGALFLGEGTTVAYGDKAIGTNHVLPTAGAARYTGGLWVGKFLKTVTYQECDPAASARIGEICARQCRLEHFEGHARSCDVRVRKYAGALV